MINREQLNRLHDLSADVIDVEGNRIGRLKELYVDDQTEDPSWATVKTGLFGMSETFVPLIAATVLGDDIRVPYTTDQVKDAPRVDPDGHLEPADEERLYSHYGFTGDGKYETGRTGFADTDTDADMTRTAGYAGRDTDRTVGTAGRGYEGDDTSGIARDDAMTLSEERVHVGTENREVGRARLRKYIVTENETRTVPVSHEEVRIEREPITDANRRNAGAGVDLGEEEHEVTLHAERPVVEKETVPVERVRLETDTVTGQETVTEEVRKEETTLDEDTDQRKRR